MALVQVAPLSWLGLQSIAEPLMWALSTGSWQGLHNEAEVVHAVREYLWAAPGLVLQKLLHDLLARADLAPRARLRSLLMLLRGDVSSLSVGNFADAFHSDVVHAIRDLGSGLHTLDMRGVWLRDDNLSDFCCALRHLPDLRVLVAPHTATDELLETIGRHCTKLHSLDVSGRTAISRRGLEALCRPGGPAASLQILDIGNLAELNIDPDDVAFLVRTLPNLVSIGTYSHVGKAMVRLSESGWTDATKLEYVHDICTTTQSMAVLVRLCPDLKRVFLDGPERGVLLDLRHLPRLRELKLHQFDSEELFPLLHETGHALRGLELLSASGPLDLTRVSALCQNLVKLDCYLMRCSDSGVISWPALRDVSVVHSHIHTNTVLGMVLGAPRLARLSVGSLLELTDADVADLCGPELQDVWLADARHLTQGAVLCFLTGCPNLRSLGELSSWDLNSDQVDELRLLCAHSNMDVALWYFASADI